MKKILKISAIVLSSVVALFLIAFSVVCFNIFSPSKLTKIVNNNADKFLTCDFSIDRAELTLFKTFPKVGIDLQNTTLVNNDTLLHAKNLIASIDVREFLRNKRVIVHDFFLDDGNVNIIIDENGNPNYNVLRSDNSDSTSNFNYFIDLKKVKTKDVDLSYNNRQSNLAASLKKSDILLKGSYNENVADGTLSLQADKFALLAKDSSRISFTGDDIALDFDGSLTDFNTIAGDLCIDLKRSVVDLDTNRYVDTLDLHLKSDVNADLSVWSLALADAECSIGECDFKLSGNAHNNEEKNAIDIDFNYETPSWDIDEVIPKIPRAIIGDVLDDMELHGKIALAGKVIGLYNDTLWPYISSDIAVKNGDLEKDDLPLSFQKIDALLDLDMDLNNQTNVNIKSLTATTKKRNKLSATGTIKNLFGKMLFDLVASGNLHITDFTEFLPKDFTKYEGLADIKMKTNFDYDSNKGFSVADMVADMDCKFTNFNILYHDTTSISSPLLTAKIKFPIQERPYKIDEWLNAKVNAGKLNIKNLSDLAVTASDVQLNAYTNDLIDSTVDLKFATSYDISNFNLNLDTVNVNLNNPKGKFVMSDEDHFIIDYQGNTARLKSGQTISFITDNLNLNAKAAYKDNEDNPILQWSPVVNLKMTNADLGVKNIDHHLLSPQLDIDFNTKKCELKKVNAKFGESDVALNGTITGIEDFIKETGLLKGSLNLTANYLNLNEILDVIDGLGAPDSLTEQAESMEKNKEDAPFIVPFGVDMSMKTTIKRALVEDVEFRNIAGQVYVKDGVLVLEEMGLTNDAAKMQLTAMYKTSRLNHLFLGFDFHLLDIKIDKLIAMIPDVDTILPMLKSFSGNAEFHFAAETYLKSNYDIKFSTLRGAAAINGKDLVVLDNETYRNISKKLLFNKKTENKIDSLSTEITIFKNEVDVYPFLVSIDKYSAIISGRHNLDMTYDYNISLVKPVRIGLDIIGMPDKLKYKVGKAKYANDFKPERKKVVESKIMELKSLINSTLKSNVKIQ